MSREAFAAFERLLEADDPGLDLARACLMVAQDAYPELDIDRYLRELELLAHQLRGKLPATDTPEERVLALNRFLFDDLGFAGNAEAYYDPRNSYLNEVIERRVGIPITLSILYMELGRRIGLPLEGLSFPGHFLVRLRLRHGTLVLDPFAFGAPVSSGELRERLKQVVPPGSTGHLTVDDLPLEPFLEPATKKQILARLLRNLKGIYMARENLERALEVLNRMRAVAPEVGVDLRDRGLLYERLECWRPAMQDLSEYLALEPQAPDSERLRAKVVELAGLSAKLN